MMGFFFRRSEALFPQSLTIPLAHFHRATGSRFLLFLLFIHRRSTPPHRSMESTNFFKSCTPREVEYMSQSQPHIDIELENDINELRSSNVYMGDSGIDENVSNLKIGKEFETEKDAYKFYNSYGRKVGFSVRIDTRTIDRKTRVVKMRKFVCSREGKRPSDKRDVNVKQHRDETRTGCKAYMTIRLGVNGKYQITNFNSDHNHILASPEDSHLLRSQRKLFAAQVMVADDYDRSGIKPKATFDLMSRQPGGRQYVGHNMVDFKNYLRTKRMNAMKQFDAEGLLQFFKTKQVEDSKFFYSIQIDSEDRITNIFWADGRMILDYDRFGDVICFDTTYRINEYGRPFAPFLGVNHHRQTIFFGAALLYDETIDSFRWLFKTFCDAMSGKMPQTILTDQDKAMSRAIKTELTRTVHRICVWHVFQNACKHLSHLFNSSESFGNDFSRCVYDFDDEGEFHHAWATMIQKYDLTNNTWLQQLFNEKEKWALVYGKKVFCADMKSTQRCESLNKELKRYLHPRQNILIFFERFERLVDDRRNAELKANFKMTQSSPTVLFPINILEHAASVYTTTIFKIFQSEYTNSLGQTVEKLEESGMVIKYQVCESKKHRLHIVTVNSMDEFLECSCRKFEFMGILCSHILKATNHTLTRLPSKYILKRWTIEAASYSFPSVVRGCRLDGDSKKLHSHRYNSLISNFVKLSSMGCQSEESFQCATKYSKLMHQELQKIFKEKAKLKRISSTEDCCNNNESCRQDDCVIVNVDNAQLKDKIVEIKKEAHETRMGNLNDFKKEDHGIKRKGAEIDEGKEEAYKIKRKEQCRGRRRLKNCLEKEKTKKCQEKVQKSEPMLYPTNEDLRDASNPIHHHTCLTKGYNGVCLDPVTTYFQSGLSHSIIQPHQSVQDYLQPSIHFPNNLSFTQLLKNTTNYAAFQHPVAGCSSSSIIGKEGQQPL